MRSGVSRPWHLTGEASARECVDRARADLETRRSESDGPQTLSESLGGQLTAEKRSVWIWSSGTPAAVRVTIAASIIGGGPQT